MRGPRGRWRTFSISLLALATEPMSGRMSANSSPPSRATVPSARTPSRSRAPPPRNRASPGVAEAVGDVLEAIEVEVGQGQGRHLPVGPGFPSRPLEGAAEAVLEERAIRQAGQRVRQRLLAQAPPEPCR